MLLVGAVALVNISLAMLSSWLGLVRVNGIVIEKQWKHNIFLASIKVWYDMWSIGKSIMKKNPQNWVQKYWALWVCQDVSVTNQMTCSHPLQNVPNWHKSAHFSNRAWLQNPWAIEIPLLFDLLGRQGRLNRPALSLQENGFEQRYIEIFCYLSCNLFSVCTTGIKHPLHVRWMQSRRVQ